MNNSKEAVMTALNEYKKKYTDKEIKIDGGILHIYYTFKAGQQGWENYFEHYQNTEMNFKEAQAEILTGFGYLGRKSTICAYRKCYVEETQESEEILILD